MTIILDNYTLPKTGHVELNLSFDIVISAEEAQKKVRWWLRDHVGMLLDADTPILMIGEKTLWRVPIYISFSHTGRFCDLGSANVDASTGEIVDPEGVKKTLEDYYEKEVKDRVPPYKPRQRESISDEYIPKHIPPAPISKFSRLKDGEA
ncbi:MAG: hypothetical protein AAB571_04155 [Chloroflexota bacterium]